jgi:photosynthetic reaction center cytochrome c subunit
MRFLATALFFAAFCLQGQDAPPPPAKKGPMVPKNLKVLPQDVNIRETMGAFRTALGQQCTFCHVAAAPGGGMPDFAADTNPKKEIARTMIVMVNEINAKFHDGKVHVACYTCHRGKNIPEMAPPAAPPAQ